MNKSIPSILNSTILILIAFSCGSKVDPSHLHVGDILFDPSSDNPDFKVCSPRIYQYYNFGKGNFSLEKKLIRKQFVDQFKKINNTEEENGYITIRFVVNCEGETDRFRVYEIDTKWKDTHFHPELTKQLLALTKLLRGWKPGEFPDSKNKFAFYQYLTFKIRSGDLVDILP